jgi:hypothetical protein
MLFLLAAMALAQSPVYRTTTPTDSKSGPWMPLDKAALASLVSIRRDAPLPAWPRTAGAILVNGDRLPGEFLIGDDAAVFLKSSLNSKGLRVPLPAIRVLWVAAPPATAPEFPDRYAWLDANRRTDVVLLRNGDTVAGDIVAFTSDGRLRIKKTADGGTVTLESQSMAAIAFNPSLAAVRKLKGPYARLVLADGTRLSVANPTADATTLKATTLFGTGIEVPVRELVALDVRQGRATPLADLKPKAEAVEPYNALAWTWQPNRTVKHRPIQLRAKSGVATFDSGLGTHPKTTLTYALDGKYRAFTALVGLDAETGRRGQAKVSILVDGKIQSIPELESLSAAHDPVPVRIDLAKAKELTLVVDFGPNGDVQADVNWADAMLIE